MIEKSRDELMNEQRKILSECHEERRKLAAEKSQLEALQEKYSKENLERVSATFLICFPSIYSCLLEDKISSIKY